MNTTAKGTLFISDMDGTLLNRNAELSAYTKAELKQLVSEGLQFSVATARTLASAEIILSGLELTVPIVLMNGVLIYDLRQKQFVKVSALPSGTVAAVASVLKSQNITGIMYGLDGNVITSFYESLDSKPLRDFVEQRKARYYKTFRQVKDFSDEPGENIIYFTLLDTYERLKPIGDALSGIHGVNAVMYGDTYSEALWYLEIFSAEASKRSAVGFLREAHGFTRAVGFGDNLNDLPLFEACDVRVAVSNARDEVKQAAHFICESNERDGVVKWIREARGCQVG